jgi:hypothetical protein
VNAAAKRRRVCNPESPIRRVQETTDNNVGDDAKLKIENGLPKQLPRNDGPQSSQKICATILRLRVGQSFSCSRAASARSAVMYARWLLPDRQYVAAGSNRVVRVGRVK